jgi:protein gp37
MSENSKIEWTDHTFNPWEGCTKVSPGCEHCYAETLVDKRYGRVKWGKGNPRRRTSENNWRGPIIWNRKTADRRATSPARLLRQPGRLARRRSADRVARRSARADPAERTPNLDWLLLTKRPENWARLMQWVRNADIHTGAEESRVVPYGDGDATNFRRMYKVGKHRAGRLLDGIEHNAFPQK